MTVREVLLRALSILFAVCSLFEYYLCAALYFYMFLVVVFNPCLAGISSVGLIGSDDALFGGGMNLARIILWCIYNVPFLALFMHMNMIIWKAFFADTKGALSFSFLYNYFAKQFHEESKCMKVCAVIYITLVCIAPFVCIVVHFTVPVAAFALSSMVLTTYVMLLGGMVAAYVIWISLGRSAYFAWKVFFRSICCRKKRDTYSSTATGSSLLKSSLEFDHDRQSDRDQCLRQGDDGKDEKVFILDPFRILERNSWDKFILSEENVFNCFRSGEFSLKEVIPICASFVLFISICALDVKSVIKTIKVYGDLKMSDSITEVFIGSWNRYIIMLYFMPLLLMTNIGTILPKWKKLTEYKGLRISIAVSLGLIGVYFVLFIVAGILLNSSLLEHLDTFQPGYHPVEPTYNNITSTPPAALCNTRTEHMSMIQIAGAPVVAQLMERNVTVAKYFMNMVYNNSDGDVWESWRLNKETEDRPRLMYDILYHNVDLDSSSDDDSFFVVGLSGMTSKSHVCFMLENLFTYWYDLGMTALIPFFSILKKYFLETMLLTWLERIGPVFTGIPSYSHYLHGLQMNSLNNTISQLPALNVSEEFMMSNMIYVGHGPSGLLVKAFTSKNDIKSFAFDSPEYKHSAVYSRSQLGYEKMINVYSKSAFASIEQDASTNIIIPVSDTPLLPDVYNTFCQVVAGCATDDRYDHFCHWAIGEQRYLSHFDDWRRPRRD